MGFDIETVEYNNTKVTPKHLQYLDQLRESGVTNMYGAGAYVEDAFGVSKTDAKNILLYWMETFDSRHGDGDR